MTQNNRKLQRSFERLEPESPKKKTGWLGYTIQGVFRIQVRREPTKYYVRDAVGGFVKAINDARLYVEDDIANAQIAVDLEQDEQLDWHIKGLTKGEADANVQINNHIFIPPQVVLHEDFIGDSGLIQKIAPETYRVIKVNLNATVDPEVTDDSGDGYSQGSLWLTPTRLWIARSVTVGSADWIPLGGDSRLFFNEDLTSLIDGVATIFPLPFTFVEGSTCVFQNGSRLRLASDYTESPSFDSVVLVYAPLEGDDLVVDGVKA